MSAFNEIRAALESEIANISGIPSASNRAWENARFEPATDPMTTWIQMRLDPLESRPAVRGINPQILYEGLFTVTIFAPQKTGPAAAETLADAIRDAYTVNDTFTSGSTTVRIRYSERDPGFSDGPWFAIPVVVSWYTYRST